MSAQLALLKSDLTHIRRYASPFEGFASVVLYTGKQMYEHIFKAKYDLWVMTYTVSCDHDIGVPVKKLIFSLGPSRIQNRRQLNGIHSKLFILVLDDVPIEAFVGSQNLVCPTNENLMVRVTNQHDLRELTHYFNHFWTQSKPLSTIPVESTKQKQK